ncbi:hypothetical protein VYU27_006377, partial [Nannochloropsis oceanica]
GAGSGMGRQIITLYEICQQKTAAGMNTGGEERGGSGGGGWGQGGGGGGAAIEEEFVSMEDPEKVDGGDFELPGFEEEEEKKAEGVFGIAGGRRK